MPSGIDPRETDFEQANSQLNDGLKSCRAVVNNYRAMLAGDRGAVAAQGACMDPGLPARESDSEDGEHGSDELIA